MSQAPMSSETPKKSNQGVIIAVVVVVVLCLCCVGGLGVWYLWTHGDALFGNVSSWLPAIM